MQPDYLMPAAGLAAVLVLLSVVVLMRRRRRAAAEPDAVEGEAALEAPSAGQDTWEVGHLDQAGPTTDPLVGTVHEARVEGGTDEDPDGQVEVRWLRAQVHTLEQTLERLSSAPAPGEEPEQVSVTAGPSLHLAGRRAARAEATTPADAARYRRQVTATLRGLAGRTAQDEAPARTMARVVAAVERLESTETVARPVLPTVAAGTALAAPSQPRPAELATPPAPSAPPAFSAPAAPAVPVEDTAPVTRTVPEPPQAPAYDDVDALGPDDDSTEQVAPVAPVPGIAPVGAVPVGGARRSSRWSRRDASHSQGRSRS